MGMWWVPCGGLLCGWWASLIGMAPGRRSASHLPPTGPGATRDPPAQQCPPCYQPVRSQGRGAPHPPGAVLTAPADGPALRPLSPQGSVYQKTNAVSEIKRVGKDSFWAKAEVSAAGPPASWVWLCGARLPRCPRFLTSPGSRVLAAAMHSQAPGRERPGAPLEPPPRWVGADRTPCRRRRRRGEPRRSAGQSRSGSDWSRSCGSGSCGRPPAGSSTTRSKARGAPAGRWGCPWG